MTHTGCLRRFSFPRISGQPGLLAALCLLFVFAVPTSADDAADAFNLAAGLYKQERWALARDAFQEFIVVHKDHEQVPIARLYLGITYSKLDMHKEAREIFRDYVKNHQTSPNLADARYRVARASYLLRDYAAAETEYKSFVDAYPKHEYLKWVYADYADTLLRRNQSALAVTYFEKALNDYPNGPMIEDVKFGLARAYELRKELTKAIKLYQQLINDKEGRRAPQAQLNLGALYFDQNNFGQAATLYLEFTQKFPTNSKVTEAHLNAGFAYYQQRQYASAIKQFEEAGKSPKLKATTQLWTGLSHKAEQDYTAAIIVLKQGYEDNQDAPIASELLFHYADCELRQANYNEARDLFVKLVTATPKGNLADDSLLFAVEAMLRAKNLEESEKLLAQFSRDYGDGPLRMHHRLQKGRLLVEKGGDENLQQALAQFRGVLEQSTIRRTQNLARFQLARTQQKLGDHDEALKTILPLAVDAKEQGTRATTPEALALQASSLVATNQFRPASESAKAYLDHFPQGAQADQSWATLAVSQMNLNDKENAKTSLAALTNGFPTSSLIAGTTYQLAQLSYAQKDFLWAEELYQGLLKLGTETPYYLPALSGLAWAEFELKKFPESAATFGRIVTDHPNDTQYAPEAGYKQGHAWQEAMQLEKAAAAYQQTFTKWAPAMPAAEGAEQEGTDYYAYRSGLQAARMQRLLKNVPAADQAYESLLEKYPKVKNLDKLLDEWALLNYEAEQFARADEIFLRLTKEVPDSPLANDAWLSLAESELIDGEIGAAKKILLTLVNKENAAAEVKELSRFQLIRIETELKDWKQVQQYANSFIKDHKESTHRPEVLFYLGEAELQQKNLVAAESHFQAILKEQANPEVAQQPWFPRVYVLLAETYFQGKKYPQVETTVASFREFDKEAPLLYQADEVLGRAFKQLAKFDEARTAFKRVIDSPTGKKTETAAKSQFLIAETHLFQKDYRKALLEYLKVSIQYQSPEWQAPSLFQAAQCHEALEEWPEAVKTYKQLIKNFGASDYATQAKPRLQAAEARVEN